uniref:TFIIS N-terminal domain-containing protein n=1 Tax=Strongyloides papillosus TaxID=174720 RepID=A0A0N5BEJ2_STREA
MDNEIQEKVRRKIHKYMEFLPDSDKTIMYLEKLSKLPVTYELLASTGVGKAVNKIVKKGTEEQSTLAKKIITEWKELVNIKQEVEDNSKKKVHEKEVKTEREEQVRKRKSFKDDDVGNSYDRPAKEIKTEEFEPTKTSFSDALKSVGTTRSRPIKRRVDSDKTTSKVISNSYDTDLIKHLVPTMRKWSPAPESKSETGKKKNEDHFEIKCVKSTIHVYAAAGKSKKVQLVNGEPPKLLTFCQDVVKKHVDMIEYVGLIPYHLLKPALERATPEQLLRIVKFNPQIESDCDELFQIICMKKPKKFINMGGETWKQTYTRTLKEEDAKFALLTSRIAKNNKASCASIRKAEVIDLKQVRSGGSFAGTRGHSSGGFSGNSRPRSGLESKYSGSSAAAATNPQKKGYLMAKTLRMFKSGVR